MPIPTNKCRPSLPYTPLQSLPNNRRFDLLGQRPPTAQMLDAEFNSLQDDVNLLAQGINDVQAGNIPGADDPLNANKVLKTDGQGTLSFTLINSHQLAPNAIVEAALAPESVTTPKIGEGAVTSSKIANESILTRHLQANTVETDKIADRAVTTAKIANAAVTTLHLASGAVTPNELASLAVTNPKVALKAIKANNIDSQMAQSGTVMMSTGLGNVNFNKISSSSFEASLIKQGAVLGSSDGLTLAPQYLPLFALFENFGAPNKFGTWMGYNIQRVVFGGEGAPTAYTMRITFKGGYSTWIHWRFKLVNPGADYAYFFRGASNYPPQYPKDCDLIIPLNEPSKNTFTLYYYPTAVFPEPETP